MMPRSDEPLRHQVDEVQVAPHLHNCELAIPQLILQPELANLKVLHAPDAPSRNHRPRRRGIA
eukprot:1645045-Heterocapsa_arctica.AAC.1